MTDLENRLDADIRNLLKAMHEGAKAKGDSYFPSRLFEMVNNKGAVAAVNACVLSVGTTGFTRLCFLGLEDCTLERFVVDHYETYKPLITEDSYAAAKWSLETVGKL